MKNYKVIEGFEDYLVFPTGKVFSLKRQIYLKPGINSGGYYQVSLCKSGKKYGRRIARLVAEAFIPQPDNKSEINHKDGDKLNNNVSNLEWVTRSGNIQHALLIGLRKVSYPNAGGPKVPINVYNYFTGKFLSKHPSQSDAIKTYGLKKRSVWRVLTGERNHTCGLTFIKVLK